MVVDDEPEIREILKEELEFAGASVWEASCGVDAISLLQSQAIQLVLTDAKMPNGNGMELLKAIKQKDPQIPLVVFITGHADFSNEVAYASGASDILYKPIDFSSLITKIQKLLIPRKFRWERKSERIRASFEVKLNVSEETKRLSGKTFDLGQGGMFVHITQNFPKIGQEVYFEIRCAPQLLSGPELISPQIDKIVGLGIVRWCRYKDDHTYKSGIGVEFLEVENANSFSDFLIKLQKTAFIPLG